MSIQKPVAWCREPDKYGRRKLSFEKPTRTTASTWHPLYALPGAQPAPSVPDEEAAYSEWFRGEQGVAYDGMWAFAKAAWMARAALSAAPKPEGE